MIARTSRGFVGGAHECGFAQRRGVTRTGSANTDSFSVLQPFSQRAFPNLRHSEVSFHSDPSQNRGPSY